MAWDMLFFSFWLMVMAKFLLEKGKFFQARDNFFFHRNRANRLFSLSRVEFDVFREIEDQKDRIDRIYQQEKRVFVLLICLLGGFLLLSPLLWLGILTSVISLYPLVSLDSMKKSIQDIERDYQYMQNSISEWLFIPRIKR